MATRVSPMSAMCTFKNDLYRWCCPPLFWVWELELLRVFHDIIQVADSEEHPPFLQTLDHVATYVHFELECFTGIDNFLHSPCHWRSLSTPGLKLHLSNTMASTPLLIGNGSANGHVPHTHLSSQSASTERIQIVNEKKNFTLVSRCSGCFQCLPPPQWARHWQFFADQTWPPKLTSGACEILASLVTSFHFLVRYPLGRVSRMLLSICSI